MQTQRNGVIEAAEQAQSTIAETAQTVKETAVDLGAKAADMGVKAGEYARGSRASRPRPRRKALTAPVTICSTWSRASRAKTSGARC